MIGEGYLGKPSPIIAVRFKAQESSHVHSTISVGSAFGKRAYHPSLLASPYLNANSAQWGVGEMSHAVFRQRHTLCMQYSGGFRF